MKSPDSFPRIPLALLPTPLERLHSLSRFLDRDLYIKRDDLTGIALGGNKVRKLEYLLAQAREQGADTVVTTGAAQSNHAMLTAACAGRLNLRAVLILKKRGVTDGRGNLALNGILGAQVRLSDTDSYDEIEREMQAFAREEAARGRKAFLIPVGGSTAVGALGYVRCAREIGEQAAGLGIRPDHLVTATSSGGTLSGLLTGARLFLPGTRVTGVAVDPEPADRAAGRLAGELRQLMELGPGADPAEISWTDQSGPGYAVPSAEGAAAIRLMARREGILLDPVYSGKAFAGLLRLLEEGRFAKGESIVFLHTGGAGALFAYDGFWQQ